VADLHREVDDAEGGEHPADAEGDQRVHAPRWQRPVGGALHPRIQVDFHQLVEGGRSEGGCGRAEDRVKQLHPFELAAARGEQEPEKRGDQHEKVQPDLHQHREVLAQAGHRRGQRRGVVRRGVRRDAIRRACGRRLRRGHVLGRRGFRAVGKRSMDGHGSVLARDALVAYTAVYVVDDVHRFRPGRPRGSGGPGRLPLPLPLLVASWRAAGRTGRPGWSWPAGVRARR
jgi:hypothetical protein